MKWPWRSHLIQVSLTVILKNTVAIVNYEISNSIIIVPIINSTVMVHVQVSLHLYGTPSSLFLHYF